MHAQVAAFTAPDTVCVGTPVTITNQSITSGTYYWNFCTGNALSAPVGINIGNPGNLLNVPTYNTLQKDGNTCYSFVSSRGNISIVRYNHGTSFSNNPVSWTNLGNFGLLNDSLLGLKICQDNGNWFGFVTNNNRLIRLEFGASLGNTPTASVVGPYAMLYSLHCVEIVKEGTNWIGFLTCNTNWKIVRIFFGNSLLNSPVLTDLGTPGGLNGPTMARVIQDSNDWFCFVVNNGNNTLTRLDFGTSLLNTPTGTNMGSPCPGINAGGIALIRDCDSTSGFQLNASPSASSPNLLWRLNFSNGLAGPVTGTPLGNIGGLARPYYFSDLIRIGDTLFLYNTNRDIPSLTRHRFLPCSNATISSSTLYDPPVFSYNQTGTYNVELIVNEGLFDQASICKNITVINPPVVDLGPDQSICAGQSTTFDAGYCAGCTYQWANLATGQTNIATSSSYTTGEAGIYAVTVTSPGCTASDIIQLDVTPEPDVTFSPEITEACSGTPIQIDLASQVANTSFQWTASGSSGNISNFFPGSGSFIQQTPLNSGSDVETVTYTITPQSAGCPGSPTDYQAVIFPIPVMSVNQPLTSLCSGATFTASFTSPTAGTMYIRTAIASSPLVSGFSGGTGSSISEALFNTSGSDQTVTYQVTPAASNCPGQSAELTVTVTPFTGISLHWCCDSVTTIAAKPFLLRGGFPFGGTWSGPGVENTTGIFTPSHAGTGLHPIGYGYTNVAGCSGTVHATMQVLPEPAFTCGGDLTDVRDGKIYPTSLIGTKCWMKTNLDFGTAIASHTPQSDNCIPEKYLNPEISNPNLLPSRSCYQWNELMQYQETPAVQGLCPPGWHIPTAQEWEDLCSYFAGPGLAGGPLKDPWKTTGFQSVQTGFLYQNDSWAFFEGIYAGSMYWTSDPAGAKRAVARGMNAIQNSVSRYEAASSDGLSVRCLRD
jgi:uncharacterized protein (TIGR02145 family)